MAGTSRCPTLKLSHQPTPWPATPRCYAVSGVHTHIHTHDVHTNLRTRTFRVKANTPHHNTPRHIHHATLHHTTPTQQTHNTTHQNTVHHNTTHNNTPQHTTHTHTPHTHTHTHTGTHTVHHINSKKLKGGTNPFSTPGQSIGQLRQRNTVGCGGSGWNRANRSFSNGGILIYLLSLCVTIFMFALWLASAEIRRTAPAFG